MQEWDSIKMVNCPHCGGLMVDGGACRGCRSSGAAGAHRTKRGGPSVPLMLGGAGLLGLVVLVAVYAFFWSGAGGAVPSPREQVYIADLAKAQVTVQQAVQEFTVVQSSSSDVTPGSAEPAMQAASAVEQVAADWKDRESPSDGFAQEHARVVASLQEMAAAAVEVREGLQDGDPGRVSAGIARFLARSSEFTVAANILFERTAGAGQAGP